jgi:CheY-like chemotaxis protein
MNAPFSPDQRRVFRDLNAERADARCSSPGRARRRDTPQTLTVCALGLDSASQQHLHELATASPGQGPSLALLAPDMAHAADVLLLDGRDPKTVAWAQDQLTWLRRRAALWLHGQPLSPLHRTLPLPVAWSELPQRLADAFQVAPPPPRGLVARQLQPEAPAVLVLSDAPSARQRCQAWLEAAGHRVTLAGRAREGLAALHATHYACVIVCGQVPDLDNRGLVRRVRSLQRKLGRVRLLYLGSEDGAVQRWAARLIGFDATAPFPGSAQGLLALLAPLTARPR